MFRFAFLVGGVTRGKAERVQSRKLWEIVERNEGKNMTPRIKKQYEKDLERLEMMKKYIELEGPITIAGTKPKTKKVKRDV